MTTQKSARTAAGATRTNDETPGKIYTPADTNNQEDNDLPLLDAALEYARRGLAVYPIAPLGKKPPDRAFSNLCAESPECSKCEHWNPNARGPRRCKLGKTGGYTVGTTNAATIQAWWERDKQTNVGVALGASKLVIIDCEGPEGVTAFAELAEALDFHLGDVPNYTTPRTQGRQYIFAAPERVTLKPNFYIIGEVVEVLAAGHGTTFPPSYYRGKPRNGSQKPERSGYYDWNLRLYYDAPPAPMPAALVDFLIDFLSTAAAEKKKAAPAAPGAPIKNHTRHITLLELSGAMRRHGATEAEIKTALYEANKRCLPPLTDAEINELAADVAARYDPLDALDPRNFTRTDTGNAEYFERLNDGRVKYDHARNRWLIKDTHYWAPDDTERVKELAVAAIRTLHRRAVDLDDRDIKEKISKHAITSENEPRLRRLLDCAKSKPGIADDGKGWDADPNLVGTPRGVVDLRTTELRDATDDDKITRIIEHYDPDATAERFELFLKEIFPDNPKFQRYIQMAFGYSLTGYTTEKCFFFCFGPTNSGKTTLLEAVLTAVGDYGDTAPFEIFQPTRAGRGEAASPFSVAMTGRRIIKSTEPETRHGKNTITFNEGMIKEMTGKDRLKRRDNYGKPFTIKVTYHLWFGANDRPNIRAEADPMWERVITIPFNQTFTGDAMDTSLEEKLADEKAGIANWIIRGAAMWWEASNGGTRPSLHDIPPEIKEANDAWRSDNDLFATFLKDECVANPACAVTTQVLYDAYRQWWTREGFRESDSRFLTRPSMGHRLRREGYESAKINRKRGWKGLALVSLYESPTEGDDEPTAANPLLEPAAAEF